MKQILVCRNCDAILTKPVIMYREVDGKRKKKSGWLYIPPPQGSGLPEIIKKEHLGENDVMKGIALKLAEPYYHMSFHSLDYKICLEDLTKNLQKNQNWESGCCGAIPKNKPNLSCTCNEEIGLEFSECYVENFFVPLNEKTKWKNV